MCDLEAAVDAGLGQGAVLEFLGADPDADLYAAASPTARLPLACPALLIHGDADAVVPIEQSRTFAARAQATGSRCELIELAGGDHFEVVSSSGRAWPVLWERLTALAGGGAVSSRG